MKHLAFALVAFLVSAAPAAAVNLIETPGLPERVAAGELPAVAERVPEEPLVVDLAARGRDAGAHGGTMKMFVTRSKDVCYMAAWGCGRLVGYNSSYELTPDLLRDVAVSDDGRSVTLHLRHGHEWSDGHPFTIEDFRHWWEDVALNPDLAPSGPPVELLAGGEQPEVEVIDEVTIKYTWPIPNPLFLPALARARPLYIYRPAHYMKRVHAKFADPDGLAEKVEKAKAEKWARLHNRRDNLYKFDNPNLPVLQPWRNTSKKNSQRYVLVRIPFYHRIDPEGRQLPYRPGGVRDRRRRADPGQGQLGRGDLADFGRLGSPTPRC